MLGVSTNIHLGGKVSAQEGGTLRPARSEPKLAPIYALPGTPTHSSSHTKSRHPRVRSPPRGSNCASGMWNCNSMGRNTPSSAWDVYSGPARCRNSPFGLVSRLPNGLPRPGKGNSEPGKLNSTRWNCSSLVWELEFQGEEYTFLVVKCVFLLPTAPEPPS